MIEIEHHPYKILLTFQMHLLFVVGLELGKQVPLLDVPNEDLSVCRASSEERVVLLTVSVAPLDGSHSTARLPFEIELW